MYQHKMPQLPFSMDALSPYISSETLDFHYNKHHRTYFEKMQKLLPGSGFEESPLEEVVKKSDGKLFNNSAQHWNHIFYWKSLAPKAGEHSSAKIPEGKLLEAIKHSFGSFEEFKTKFDAAATEVFGSGWAWLVSDPSGKLEILATSNGDNPLRHGKTPLLTVDVWEHAYYIDYRNARPKYLDAMWEVLNWDFAKSNFENLGKQIYIAA